MKTKNILLVLILALTLIKMNFAHGSVCKELSQSSCEKLRECRWINSYKRKDGKSVKAYCRKSGSKSKRGLKSSGNTTNQSYYRNYEDKWLLDK